VLAVALSHRLDLPLLQTPQPGCLLVDDVYETGLTLAPHRELADARVVVWVSKVEPQWWQAVEVMSSSEWLVFPWEDAAAASADEAAYRASRP
jgi:hypoxanthine phosphoribosyltransferase